MKKLILIVLIALLFFAGAYSLSAKQENKRENPYIEKTYFLKNVSAEFAVRSLQVYISHHSAKGNILSVTIRKEKVKRFEELLNKIDIERKRINFRIFAVIGSHNGASQKIKNKDLNNVINELRDLLSLNSFKLDGIGSIAVMDGSRRSSISLSSRSGLELRLHLRDISIKKKTTGKREVHFQFDLPPYISSMTYIREKGYLVAGVSKIGKNGDSLILVINTEIE